MRNVFEIIGEWFAKNKPNAELVHIDKVELNDNQFGYHVAYAETADDETTILVEAVCVVEPKADSLGMEYAVKAIDDLHIFFEGKEVNLKDIDISVFANAAKCNKAKA